MKKRSLSLKALLNQEYEASIKLIFKSDRLLELKEIHRLERIVGSEVNVKCLNHTRQLVRYKDGSTDFEINAIYSLEFSGSEKILDNVLKFFQEIFPDYFVSMELKYKF